MGNSRNLADFSGIANPLYEEGTWTPTTASGSWLVNNADYVRVGKLVTCSCQLNATSNIAASDFSGLPFAADPTKDGGGAVTFQNEEANVVWSTLVQGGNNVWNWRRGSAQKGLSNGNTVYCTFSYFTI